MVVVGQGHERPLTVTDQLLQTQVVLEVEGDIVAFRLVIGRIQVEERPFFVIPGDDGLVAEVFNDHIL